ncbi:MAG: ankyrin repeat domain-containing protein [Gammaproteobacteria bacterium]|nr:ankyrin repeat domain-containing protein [Gammaproteobacteria bacterium]
MPTKAKFTIKRDTPRGRVLLCFESKEQAEAYQAEIEKVLGKKHDDIQISKDEKKPGQFNLGLSTMLFDALRQKERSSQKTYSEGPFFVKNLRGDEGNFSHNFFESVTLGPDEIRKVLRKGGRTGKERYTAKGTGVEDRLARQPQYTPEQKEGFSKPQSLSYVNPSKRIVPDLFQSGEDTEADVAFFFSKKDILVNRIFIYDYTGTYGRPYDAKTESEVSTYVSRYKGDTLFSDLESLEKELEDGRVDHLTEIMGRARFDSQADAIAISSDSIRSRWLAAGYAQHLEQDLLPEREEAYGRNAKKEDVALYYYLPGTPQHLKPYSSLEQALDKEEANRLYQNPTQRQALFEKNQFEFLLCADQVNCLAPYKNGTVFEAIIQSGYTHIAELLFMQATPQMRAELMKIVMKPEQFGVLVSHDQAQWLMTCFKMQPSLILYKAILSTADPVVYANTLLSSPGIESYLGVKNEKGKTLLDIALEEKAWPQVERLIRLQAVNKDNVRGYLKALELAVIAKRSDVVTRILDAEIMDEVAKLKLEDADNAYHYAVRHGHEGILRNLLSDPSSVLLNQKNADGDTPIMLAAKKGAWEDIGVFLRAVSRHPELEEAFFLQKNKQGDTLLMIAAKAGKWGAVNQMVEQMRAYPACYNQFHPVSALATVANQVETVKAISVVVRGVSPATYSSDSSYGPSPTTTPSQSPQRIERKSPMERMPDKSLPPAAASHLLRSATPVRQSGVPTQRTATPVRAGQKTTYYQKQMEQLKAPVAAPVGVKPRGLK